MDLTDGQKEAVSLLYFNPRYEMPTNELVTRLNADRVHPEWTYDRLMGVLRGLEKRDIVVRSDTPARWQLTKEARKHLKKEEWCIELSQKPLDLKAIAGLVEEADKEEREKIATKVRNKQWPTEPRDYETWFRLPTRFADCSRADDCIDPRVDKSKTGHTMVAVVNGSEICRFCFLAGANKP